jgi:hypothetical protein
MKKYLAKRAAEAANGTSSNKSDTDEDDEFIYTDEDDELF